MDIHQRLSRWQLAAPALLVQALVFAAGVAALQRAGVSAAAWAGLYLCAAVATVTAPCWGPLRAGLWLALAGYALLFSALFWGANFGLDALHGAHRHKADVAQRLGGLELWFVLCPGVVSVALAAAVQACWASPFLKVSTTARVAPAKE